MDFCESGASLVYSVSSWTAKATQKSYLKQNKTTTTTKSVYLKRRCPFSAKMTEQKLHLLLWLEINKPQITGICGAKETLQTRDPEMGRLSPIPEGTDTECH